MNQKGYGRKPEKPDTIIEPANSQPDALPLCQLDRHAFSTPNQIHLVWQLNRLICIYKVYAAFVLSAITFKVLHMHSKVSRIHGHISGNKFPKVLSVLLSQCPICFQVIQNGHFDSGSLVRGHEKVTRTGQIRRIWCVLHLIHLSSKIPLPKVLSEETRCLERFRTCAKCVWLFVLKEKTVRRN